ncbi:MAG: DUF2974 domain-containing protein, partial [Bacilli bacterium]|nr:DUF2974 domain-containing protein [Bacilli bacterium]
MANIIDYINEFGTYDFEEFPFNSVDSLILSELSYFLFGKHVPSIIEKSKGVKLHSFYNKEKIIKEFIDKSLETKANAKLLEALFHSRRFGGLLINYYDSQFSVIEETQFAAMVFHLGTIDYIAFRGTDATIMGWKEDFNMAILDSIPAQSLAVEYLNKVIPHLNNDIYVGGHSKG